jgi:hypothetical protein
MVESRYKYLDIIHVTHSTSMIYCVKTVVLVPLFLLKKWTWSNIGILVFILIVEYMLYLINWMKCIYTLLLSLVNLKWWGIYPVTCVIVVAQGWLHKSEFLLLLWFYCLWFSMKHVIQFTDIFNLAIYRS